MAQLVSRAGSSAMAHEYTVFVCGLGRVYESWADTGVVTVPSGDLERDLATALLSVRGCEVSGHARVLVERPDETVLETKAGLGSGRRPLP